MNGIRLFLPLIALTSALGCTKTPPVTTEAHHAVVRVDATEAWPAPRGRLIVGWLTPEESNDVRAHGPSLVTWRDLFTERLVPLGEVDHDTLARGVPFAFANAKSGALPFAIVSFCDDFFSTLTGGCPGNLFGTGSDVGADIVVTKRNDPQPQKTDVCTGPGRELVRIDVPRVAGAIGNNTSRRLCVHVPASYATSEARRYPVVYYLPGLTGGDQSPFRAHLDAMADDVAIEEHRDFIFVGVDTSTKLGSSYLVDSSCDGDFETFLSDDVTRAIDRRYRTLATPRARALMGQSTGGFNAVSYALRHSDTFTAIAAMSPDGLDIGSWLLEADGKTTRSKWLHDLQIEDAMGGVGQMASYGASWSPDAKVARGFDWPVDPKSGVVNDTWSKWRAASPSEIVRRPEIADAVRARLSGRIYITVARTDEFDLFAPALLFADELHAMKIDATFVPSGAGHRDGFDVRARASLAFLARTLDASK